MEKSTVFSIGKYTSIIVMTTTSAIAGITMYTEYLAGIDWGRVVIAFGVFLVAVRNYMKDHYGMF
jgi:cadmium resistance protein CadD (predicted permease)